MLEELIDDAIIGNLNLEIKNLLLQRRIDDAYELFQTIKKVGRQPILDIDKSTIQNIYERLFDENNEKAILEVYQITEIPINLNKELIEQRLKELLFYGKVKEAFELSEASNIKLNLNYEKVRYLYRIYLSKNQYTAINYLNKKTNIPIKISKKKMERVYRNSIEHGNYKQTLAIEELIGYKPFSIIEDEIIHFIYIGKINKANEIANELNVDKKVLELIYNKVYLMFLENKEFKQLEETISKSGIKPNEYFIKEFKTKYAPTGI